MTDPYQVIERLEERDFIIRDMRDGQEYGRYDSKVSAFNAALRLKNKEVAALLTTAQAAAELGVYPQHVRRLIGEGRLAAQKVGRDHLIDRADLDRLERRSRGRPRKEEQ